MKNLAMSLVVILAGLSATAQDSNYCTFGSFQRSVDRFGFSEVHSNFPFYKEYSAVINDQIKVSVSRSQGHSAIYYMIVSYNDGEVLIQDTYADFAPLRDLHISAKFNGQGLYCVYTPNF